MRRFLRCAILLALVAATVLLVLRLRPRPASAPAAAPPAEPEAPPAGEPEAPPAPDDLAEVWGIGPVYRARLAEAGITTFASLAATDPAEVVAATGVPTGRAADWIAQAAARATH